MSEHPLSHLAILLGGLIAAAAQPAAAAAADACTPQALRELAAPLDAPRGVLQAAIAAEEPDTDLAPPLRAALGRLKPAVAALVDARLNCLASDKAPDLAALTAALDQAANGSDAAPAAGASRGITFEPAYLSEAGWLAVVAAVAIPCGSDAQLLLYAPHDGRWRRRLRWASADYARVDGAWEALQYRVSPPAADGRRFVAVSHIRPWCSSTWSRIDYSVLRPAAGERPETVLQGSDNLWWGGEDFGRISLDARHFELRFHAASLDSGVHNREFVRRYDLSGAKPKRVPPVASSPRDFVDEWIISDWGQARQWSATPDTLQSHHHALHALRLRYAPFEFGSSKACTNGNRVQVELRSGENEETAFFRVDGDASDYRLGAVSAAPDPHCTKELAPPDLP